MYNAYFVDIPNTRDIQHQQGSMHRRIISVVQVVIQREHPKGFISVMWTGFFSMIVKILLTISSGKFTTSQI